MKTIDANTLIERYPTDAGAMMKVLNVPREQWHELSTHPSPTLRRFLVQRVTKEQLMYFLADSDQGVRNRIMSRL